MSQVLIGEPVGLLALEDGSTEVRYGPLLLGTICDAGRFKRGARRRRKVNDPDDEKYEITRT